MSGRIEQLARTVTACFILFTIRIRCNCSSEQTSRWIMRLYKFD